MRNFRLVQPCTSLEMWPDIKHQNSMSKILWLAEHWRKKTVKRKQPRTGVCTILSPVTELHIFFFHNRILPEEKKKLHCITYPVMIFVGAFWLFSIRGIAMEWSVYNWYAQDCRASKKFSSFQSYTKLKKVKGSLLSGAYPGGRPPGAQWII